MHKHTAVFTVVLAALLGSSCSDSGARLTAPGTLAAVAAPTFSITPTEVTTTTQLMRALPGASCPSHAPVTIPLIVTVFHRGIPGLVVRQVRLDFLDVFGVRMPQVTIPAPLPINEFGTGLADTRDRLTFPINAGLGCGTATTGTLSVWVDTRDEHGNEQTGRLQVRVR